MTNQERRASNIKPLFQSLAYIFICITVSFFISHLIGTDSGIDFNTSTILSGLLITFFNSFFVRKIIIFNESTYTRRLNSSEVLILFIFLITIINIQYIYSLSNSFGELINGPGSLYFISIFLLSLTGCIINYRSQNPLSRSNNDRIPLDDQDFKLITNKIVSSNHYLSALSTVLPKYRENEDGSAIHIAFILAVIQKRRDHYQRTTNLFFTALVIFSLAFSFLLSYFGFIIIDRIDIGFAKSVQEVQEKIVYFDEFRLKYSDFEKEIRKSQYDFNNNYDLFFEETKKENPNLLSGFKFNLFNNKSIPEDSKIAYLLEYIQSLKKKDSFKKSKPSYKESLKSIEDSFKLIRSEMYFSTDPTGNSGLKYIDLKDEIKSLIDKAKKADDNSKIYTLLKRLAISIVISSFFFGILRYLAQQYNVHLRQLEAANADELALRKFYIAYDLAGDNKIASNDLLQQFSKSEGAINLSKADQAATSSAKENDGLDAGDKKIISEILEIIKKKL